VAFILFTFAWPIFFLLHAINPQFTSKKSQSIKYRKHIHRLLLTLNFSSAALWISFTFSLKWLEPAVVSALIGGIGIIATLTLIKFIRPSTTLIGADYIATTIIAAASIYLAWISTNGHTALEEKLDSQQVIEGYFAMIICGIAMAFYIYYIQKTRRPWSIKSLHLRSSLLPATNNYGRIFTAQSKRVTQGT
jgi:hypothetical protein